MRLYLMQHGANLPESVDPDKGVSPVGRDEVENCAAAAVRMGIGFSDILASPKKRSLQTARLMASLTGFPEDDVAVHEDFKAMADPERTVRKLLELGVGPEVLVCGHLPNLNRVACHLLGCGPDIALGFKNAGLACLSLERLPTRSAVLSWLLTPAQLAAVSGGTPAGAAQG